MQVSFTLRKDKINKDGLIPVRMLITFDGERIRRDIKGVKTFEKDWRLKEQRIKTPTKKEPYNYHIEYNKILHETEDKVEKLFRYILLNDIKPTKDFILDKIDNDELENTHLSNEFIPSFDEFIRKGKNIKTNSTLLRYGTSLNFYKDFSNDTSYKLRFDTINVEFFERFRDYAFEERNTLNNYFAKLISNLKTFMKWSFDRGYHENLEFQKFKASEQEIEVIYLTMAELMKLYKFEFTSKRLEQVRDTYCFGCFTGLRFSDIKQLKISNIFKDYLKLSIKKTKDIDHKIPLNNFSKSILEKYRDTINQPLPIISSVKFNKYIKECCMIAEIDTPTSITRFIGKKRIDKVVPKYELITSHTARKTFVTNSLVLGMKEIVVRSITGHKKEQSFRKYVVIAEDLKKQEMDNTWNKIK